MNFSPKKINLWGAMLLLLIYPVNAFSMARRPEAPAQKQAVSANSETFDQRLEKKLNFENFIRLALARSTVVRASREDIQIARAQALQAIGVAVGDGDFVITHNFQEKQAEAAAGGSSVGGTFNSPHRRERKFMFSQPLFQGFKSVGALVGAGSLTKQRKEEYEFTKETFFVDITEAFYALVSAQKRLDILNENKKLYGERINELGEREKIGRSRAGEVSMARAKEKILNARIASARGALLSAQSLVGFYTGIAHVQVEDDDPETFTETLEIDSENYAAIAAGRADVEAAVQAEKTAKQAIVVAQSSLWPKLTLDANHYEKREGFQDGISWDAILKLDVPLFRGGDNLGKLAEAVSNYKKAKWNCDLTRKKAILEIEQAHQGWIAAREQASAYKEAVKAGQENFDLQKADYASNLVNNLEVLAALEELISIRENSNTSEYQMKTNYWQFQIAVSRRIPEWAENKTKDKRR